MENQLKDFSLEMNNYLQESDQKMQNELLNLEKKCFQQNDIEKFVVCMESNVNKLEKEQKNLEFKISFLQKKIVDCFQRANEGKKDFEKCKLQAKQSLVGYVDDFLFSIRK